MSAHHLHLRLPEPQWAADPSGRHALRWWDGGAWSPFTSDGAGIVTDDPWYVDAQVAPPRTMRPRWPRRAGFAMGLAVVGLLSSPFAFMALTTSMDQPDDVVTQSTLLAVGAMVMGAACLVVALVLALWGMRRQDWASPRSLESFRNRFAVVWVLGTVVAVLLWILLLGVDG